MNPDDLVGETNGIYAKGAGYDWDDGDGSDYTHSKANYWQDWEREMNFEFFEADGTKGVDFDAGLRYSASFPESRAEELFGSFAREVRAVQRDIPFSQGLRRDDVQLSCTAFLRTGLAEDQNTDAFVGQIEKGVTDLDYMEYRPVALYINGSFLGPV